MTLGPIINIHALVAYMSHLNVCTKQSAKQCTGYDVFPASNGQWLTRSTLHVVERALARWPVRGDSLEGFDFVAMSKFVGFQVSAHSLIHLVGNVQIGMQVTSTLIYVGVNRVVHFALQSTKEDVTNVICERCLIRCIVRSKTLHGDVDKCTMVCLLCSIKFDSCCLCNNSAVPIIIPALDMTYSRARISLPIKQIGGHDF